MNPRLLPLSTTSALIGLSLCAANVAAQTKWGLARRLCHQQFSQ